MRRKFVWTIVCTAAIAVALPARAQVAADGEPPVASARPAARGPGDAPVHIVEFCNFESEACGRLAVVMHGILRDFPDKVRFEFRHRAEDAQVDSPAAYRAALAAGAQGRFWEMHDMLFANQDRLTRHDLVGMATQLGLDIPQFSADLDSVTLANVVAEDAEEARGLKVTQTPAFFVNGERLADVRSRVDLEAAIDRTPGRE
jgi:protein-disulfide isomerase